MDMSSTRHIQRRSPNWRDLPIDLISRSPIARWAPIPLRLIVGYGFMQHGFAKLARARMRSLRSCTHLAYQHRI
jgi:putative oxidoreductase